MSEVSPLSLYMSIRLLQTLSHKTLRMTLQSKQDRYQFHLVDEETVTLRLNDLPAQGHRPGLSSKPGDGPALTLTGQHSSQDTTLQSPVSR